MEDYKASVMVLPPNHKKFPEMQIWPVHHSLADTHLLESHRLGLQGCAPEIIHLLWSSISL